MSRAMVNFAREYDVVLNPKVMAGVQLAATLSMVYVPRLLMIASRIRKQKQRAPIETKAGPVTEQHDERSAPIN
jgi:hypothetical protein